MMVKKFLCIFLCFVLAFSSVKVIFADESDDPGFNLDNFIFDDPEIEITTDTPDFSDMTLVGENNRLKFYFYESGLDIYVVDKTTGKIWSNVLMSEYCKADVSAEVSSQMASVSVADKESQSSYTLFDSSNSNITAVSNISDEKLVLQVEIPNAQIGFDIEFGLHEDGFYYLVPNSSIKEGKGKIVSINIMDNFGASKTDEDGYVFYPDGCGAIVNFKPWDEDNAILHRDGVYGSVGLNYLNMERNLDDNIEGVLIPVYGIKQKDSGFVAVMESGESDSFVNLSMPGYQVSGIYRAFFSHNYRYYSDTLFNGTNVTAMVEDRVVSDRKVNYYLLSGQENNYSGMACRVRKFYEDNEVLTGNVEIDKLPLTTEFLCAVRKNGMLSSNVQSMTSFAQVKTISEDINKNNQIAQNIVLSGWGKGGWDTLPTELTAERKVGGKSALNSLLKYCSKESIGIFLSVDPILANSDTGSFNISKDTVKNYFGEPYCDKTNTKYVLSAKAVMDKTISAFNKSFDNFGINLLTVGRMLSPDYNNKNSASRTDMMNAYIKSLQDCKEQISVTDGNAYSFKYAKQILEVPSDSSGYIYMDESVPFWQMVVHGSKLYTGQFANSYHDYKEYLLKTVEAGSVPSFILTNEDTGKLLQTNYGDVFSTKYESLKESIAETVKRLEKDTLKLYSKKMMGHEIILNDIVKVTYEDNCVVYINYGEKSVDIESKTIRAQDYLVVEEG